ncbi:MAG: hypothetical protein QOF98_3644, partial [Streptomyces sp.]|nr:hypothetical protein [Streptomyces sp.]
MSEIYSQEPGIREVSREVSPEAGYEAGRELVIGVDAGGTRS